MSTDLQPQSQPQSPGATDSNPKRPKRISGRSQSYQVQAFVFNCLKAYETALTGPTRKGELKLSREDATAVAQLVRAWESAQERVRINRGRPLPGTLRPKEKKPKRPTAWLWPTAVPTPHTVDTK